MIIAAGAAFPVSLNTLIKMLSRFRHQFKPKGAVKAAGDGDHDAIAGRVWEVLTTSIRR